MAKHQTGDKDSTQASGHSGRVGQALGEQPFLPLGPLQSKGLLWVLVLTCGLCPLCRLADWCQALAAAVLHPSHAFPLQALMQNEAFDSTDTMMWQQALLAIAALRYLSQSLARPEPPMGLVAPGISYPGGTVFGPLLCHLSAHQWVRQDGSGCSRAPRRPLAFPLKEEAGDGKGFRVHWPGLPSVPDSAEWGREEMPCLCCAGSAPGTAGHSVCGHLPQCRSPCIQLASSLLTANTGKTCWTTASTNT